MDRNRVSSFKKRLKLPLLPLILGTALLAASPLLGGGSFNLLNKGRSAKKPSSSIHLSNPVQVNPAADFLCKKGSVAIEDLFQPILPKLIQAQYHSYEIGRIFVNPKDKNNLFVTFSQDRFKESDGPRTYVSLTNGGPQLAISNDGGRSWNYSTPALPTWSGGSLGQTVKGDHLAFLGSKTLLFAGSSNETRPLPSDGTDPQSKAFVAKSNDGGFTWEDPVIIESGNSGAFTIPNEGGPAAGIETSSSSLLAHPSNGLVHLSLTHRDLSRNTFYGNIFYSRSRDRGKTWEPARLIYEMSNDPVWVRRHGWLNPGAVPPIPLGGQAGISTLVHIPSKFQEGSSKEFSKNGILIAGFSRIYPQPGVDFYTQEPSNSFFDHAIIRSFDLGKTWTQEAIEVGQYVFAAAHNPTAPRIFDLYLNTNDGALNNRIAVSPKSGRIYFAWQGGNPAVSAYQEVNQFFPIIQLASSSDQGVSWSPTVAVCRTPFNSAIKGANQAFNCYIEVTDSGYVGITYEDFRFYDGSSVYVAADVWLAIYKETKNPKGGSTGVGLDFIKEVRLTSQSFNALIGFNSPLNGIGANTALAFAGNQFFTAFGVTNQNNLPATIGPFHSIQDLNNRLNIFFEKVTLQKKLK